MKKFAGLSFTILLFLSAFGCRATPENHVEKSPAVNPAVSPKDEPNKILTKIDIPKLANKPPAEVDQILGPPAETKPLSDPLPGEYRLYKTAKYPKGLAVRFYRNKAVIFNLVLAEPMASSKEALKEVFNIDVGQTAPSREKNEPLTEKWQGTFGGVKFNKVSAKREDSSGGFILVLAEVAK